MRVPPSRAHSARIVLTGAFCAFSVTRPLLNCRLTACADEDAAQPSSTTAQAITI